METDSSMEMKKGMEEEEEMEEGMGMETDCSMEMKKGVE